MRGPDPDSVWSARNSPVARPLNVCESAPAPSRLSAASTSSIDEKRWFGLFDMHLAMSASNASDTCVFGFICRRGGASSFTCAIKMLTLFGRSKGTLPAIISYMMMPSA